MQAEFITLAKSHLPLVYMFAAGTLFGMAVEWLAKQSRRRRWRRSNRDRSAEPMGGERDSSTTAQPSAPRLIDAADQLRIVMRAQFSIQPLLNRKEARVFRELDKIVIGCNPDWQVMAQVSLGEILRSKDTAAYGCINSKRVDLLLVDGDCQPRHAIEYQGGGHYQGTAAARDAVKKEALRRAGIGYHEVVAGQTTPVELRRLVEKLVEKPVAA
jgi:hypothetical protein